jgi:hypothetical protein
MITNEKEIGINANITNGQVCRQLSNEELKPLKFNIKDYFKEGCIKFISSLKIKVSPAVIKILKAELIAVNFVNAGLISWILFQLMNGNRAVFYEVWPSIAGFEFLFCVALLVVDVAWWVHALRGAIKEATARITSQNA